jgi:hypothetical protein
MKLFIMLIFCYSLNIPAEKLMQTWTILQCLILRLVLFVTIAVVFYSLSWPTNAFALSPAFGRQEIGSPWAATSTFPFFTFGELCTQLCLSKPLLARL